MFAWRTRGYRREPSDHELDALLRATLLRLCEQAAADGSRTPDARWSELRKRIEAGAREPARRLTWRGKNT